MYYISANICKQIMEKLLLKKFKPHHCQPQMKPVRVKETTKTCDNLVYVFDEMYTLYEVLEDMEDGTFRCVELNIQDKVFQRTRSLNFGLVGIFQYHGYTTVEKILTEEELSGKVIRLEDLLVTVPRNVLVER